MSEIETLEYSTSMATLQGLYQPLPSSPSTNFSGGRRFITGNRCERGLGKEKTKKEMSEPV